MVDGKSFLLADEVRYVQRCAAKHDGQIITVGQLILFSTQTGMRGCWILRIGWLRAWHAMGSPNPSISKKPMSPSRSIGRGTTASRVPHSSSSIAIPAKPEPSWDTRRINSNTSDKAENFKYFWLEFSSGCPGSDVFHHACILGLEGIVSKRKDSQYRRVARPLDQEHGSAALFSRL